MNELKEKQVFSFPKDKRVLFTGKLLLEVFKWSNPFDSESIGDKQKLTSGHEKIENRLVVLIQNCAMFRCPHDRPSIRNVLR